MRLLTICLFLAGALAAADAKYDSSRRAGSRCRDLVRSPRLSIKSEPKKGEEVCGN
jgi:hypothetical protein